MKLNTTYFLIDSFQYLRCRSFLYFVKTHILLTLTRSIVSHVSRRYKEKANTFYFFLVIILSKLWLRRRLVKRVASDVTKKKQH